MPSVEGAPVALCRAFIDKQRPEVLQTSMIVYMWQPNKGKLNGGMLAQCAYSPTHSCLNKRVVQQPSGGRSLQRPSSALNRCRQLYAVRLAQTL